MRICRCGKQYSCDHDYVGGLRNEESRRTNQSSYLYNNTERRDTRNTRNNLVRQTNNEYVGKQEERTRGTKVRSSTWKEVDLKRSPDWEDINHKRNSLSRESTRISTNRDVIDAGRAQNEDDSSSYSFILRSGDQVQQQRKGNGRKTLQQHKYQDYENFKFPAELKASSVNKNYSKTVQFKVNTAEENSM